MPLRRVSPISLLTQYSLSSSPKLSALDDRQTTVIAKEPVPLEGAYVSIYTETPAAQQLLGVAATLSKALVIWRHSHLVIGHPVWQQALFADGC